MEITDKIAGISSQKWTAIYMKCLAAILVYGAVVHVRNMLGMTHGPWSSLPRLWRVMDVVLLAFDAAVAVGLWLTQPWSAVAFAVGILLSQSLRADSKGRTGS